MSSSDDESDHGEEAFFDHEYGEEEVSSIESLSDAGSIADEKGDVEGSNSRKNGTGKTESPGVVVEGVNLQDIKDLLDLKENESRGLDVFARVQAQN